MKSSNNALVFLADDDSDDREFFSSASAEVNGEIETKLFNDGKQLLDYLNAAECRFPDIIFLDINMPKKDGFQSLAEIRASEKLSHLCVIMYSTSNNTSDIRKSYQLGANGFVQKPYSFTGLKELLARIFETDWSDPCNALEEQNFVLKPELPQV